MNPNILSIDFADILLLKSKYWECKKSHCRWLVCELLGGKYQEMALFFYMIIRNLTWMGVFWKSYDWRTFRKILVSLSHFMPATLEEVKISRIHDFILSCRGLYCFNNLNKISLPKYDRAIVIVKKKKTVN